MQILNFCVILRANSFSITERRGFNLSHHVEKSAASGGYLKLLAFENILLLTNHEGKNKIIAPKDLKILAQVEKWLVSSSAERVRQPQAAKRA